MPIKWKPMIMSLPYVIVVVLAKLLLRKFGQPGFLEFSDLSIIYTGGVFLLGFNLAGTMADYKESERIPGELACILETMEDSLKQAARLKPDLDLNYVRTLHSRVLASIIDWLLHKENQSALFGDVSEAIEVAYTLDKAGTPAIAGRYVSELHNVRKCVTRMGVISRTGALESGLAFLQFLTAIIIVLLLLSKFKHIVSEVILVSFVSLIYVYMLRLIHDIDDPFEYNPDGKRRGSAEVELFPLIEYQHRLRARLEPTPAESPSAPLAAAVTKPGDTPVPHSPAPASKDPSSDSDADHTSIAHTANTAHATTTAGNPGATHGHESHGHTSAGHGSGVGEGHLQPHAREPGSTH